MNAPLIFLAIEVAAIVCATLVVARVLIGPRRPFGALLIALIAFDTACGVVLAHQEYGPWMPVAFRIDVGRWAVALNLARNLTPGLLMILCQTLFTDGRRFPRWLLVLLAIQLCLEEPGRALIPASWRLAQLATQTGPALLQTLFLGVALYLTLADWRVDLVESRRRARAATLAFVSLVGIAEVLLTRVLIDPNSKANYFVHIALTATYLPILVLVLFRLMDGDLGEVIAAGRAARAGQSSADVESQSALGRLAALLEDEEICQQPGLSLRALADRVGLPEYRLRRLIHERLGYRNFNALLHDYRVKAACRRLRDPDMRRTPILTIALSVGYSSVNTFNRGFREVMKVTPSEYRALELAGDAAKTAPESD